MNVFSTCWNSKRHQDGESMCEEIRQLGFEHIEASHGLPLSMMPGLIKAVESGLIKVAGVHNFCPAPIDVPGDAPDVFEFTSHRPADRQRAMRLSKETLDIAAQLKAKYVVLHMGRVPFIRKDEGTKRLQRMAREGLLGTQEYAQVKGELVRKRQKLAPLYYQRALEALHELAPLARERGLVLGVEGRSHFEQVPSEYEMPLIMQEFANEPAIVYWHDFGHIHRKHNLLLLNHSQYLAELQPYLYGAHVNDVQWPARDHRAPFGGQVDFANLLGSYFRPDMPLSWELSSSVKKEQILSAKLQWGELISSIF